MVSSPLLAFMLDSIFYHHDLVKTKASNERFGRSRTNPYRTYTRQSLQRFHQTSAPVLPNKIRSDKGKIGGFFLSQLYGTVYYGHHFQIYGTIILICVGSIFYSLMAEIGPDKPG